MFKKLNNTTWKQIVSDSFRDRLEVIIGDDKQPDFKPQIKIQRWDNEVNASFRLIDNILLNKIPSTDGNKIKLSSSKKEVNFYNIPSSSELKEAGYEFEVTLKNKPLTNKVRFSINDKDVEYYYQPALTSEILHEGQTADETHVYDKDGHILKYRPENIVGSYAVYTKTPKVNLKDRKLYRSGKVGHIYRPKITDADGNWIWGDLNIANKILTITIDQNWLDNAVYPVVVDPTFGYDTKGGSVTNPSTDNAPGYRYQSGGDGIVSSVTVYTHDQNNGATALRLGIYNESSESGNYYAESKKGVTADTSLTANYDGWKTIEISAGNVADNTSYFLLFQEKAAVGGDLVFYYDSGSSTYGGKISSNPYSNWKSPINYMNDWGGGDSSKYSLYATFVTTYDMSYGDAYSPGSHDSFNNVSTGTIDSSHFITSFEGPNSHGYCVIGSVSGSEISYGSLYEFTNDPYSTSLAMLDSTHFVVVYADWDNNEYGTAIIGTISGSSISYGSPYVFNSGNTALDALVTSLDSTHFVVAYANVANNEKGTAVLGTVSGSTISYGSPVIFRDSDSDGSSNYISITSLDSSHFVVSYKVKSTSKILARLGSVSGSTITFSASHETPDQNCDGPTISSLDSTHFVIAYRSSNVNKAILGSVSGTDLNDFGSSVVFDESSTYSYFPITSLDQYHFIISFGGDNCSTSVIGSVINSSLNFRGTTSFDSQNIYDLSNTALDDSNFVLMYRASSGVGGYGRVFHLYPVSVQSEIFSADSYLHPVYNFVSNSSLLKTVNNSVTSDSYLFSNVTTYSSSFTSDSYLVPNVTTYSNTLSGNASIKNTLQNQFIAASNLESIVTQSLSVDSSLLETLSTLFTGSSSLKGTVQSSLSGDSNLLISKADIFVSTANLKIYNSNTFSGASNLKSTKVDSIYGTSNLLIQNVSGNFSANSSLSSIASNILSADSNILKAVSSSFSSDSNVSGSSNTIFNGNASLSINIKSQFISNASLQELAQNTFSGNAAVYNSTILVAPTDSSYDNSPITFKWKIPSDSSNRSIFAHLEVDKTDNTFNDLEVNTYSYQGSGFEYWNGSAWVSYPDTGVTSAYYGNEARYITNLTTGKKFWKVTCGTQC